MKKEKVVVIGAGPAGLAAAYELLKNSKKYEVTVLEESEFIGGISRTVYYKGNNFDIGGHRFHTRIPVVEKWWEEILPLQGAPSYDDKKLSRDGVTKKGGPDPEKEDGVLLRRNRLSRIFFKNKFFDYPVSLSAKTIKNMGLGTTFVVGCSFLKSRIHRCPEKSLEDYYINQFGRKLYEMFFEDYTENLWGRHPRDISPEYGLERVNDEISVLKMLKDLMIGVAKKKEKEIDEFDYPKLGPGQMWEMVAKKIEEKGGKIVFGAKVLGVNIGGDNKISVVRYISGDKEKKVAADYVVSSMPLKDLVMGMDVAPEEIRTIAKDLPYRDYIMVGVLTDGMKIKNKTKIKTLGDIIPDEWVYVHEKNVKMGRLQIFNNWSPYLVADPENRVLMGVEYFCDEGDKMWQMKDSDLEKMAISEMREVGIIMDDTKVIDAVVIRLKKAYPAYFDSYARIDDLKDYLDKIPNLYCVGRNGRHCYSDLDYSICSSFEAAKNIIDGNKTKKNIWNSQNLKKYAQKNSKNTEIRR